MAGARGFALGPGAARGAFILSALVPFCGLSVAVVCAVALALARAAIAAAASRALRMFCLLGSDCLKNLRRPRNVPQFRCDGAGYQPVRSRCRRFTMRQRGASPAYKPVAYGVGPTCPPVKAPASQSTIRITSTN